MHEANALYTVVSRLRHAVLDGAVARQPPGYVLRLDRDRVDASRFERLAELGRRTLVRGEPEAAAETLHAALELWRGPPFEEFVESRLLQVEAERLEERRLGTLEDRIDADLLLGRHAELVAELEVLASANPTRERLVAQRLLA